MAALSKLRASYRTSGVPTGGLGYYSATKRLSSPASSSLDKAPGTLSAKTKADLAAAGQAAQRIIDTTPRALGKDLTAAMRSYDYAGALFAKDSLLLTENQMISKFVAKATPEQKLQLFSASKDLGAGSQRAVMEAINESNTTPGSTLGADGRINPLIVVGALIAAALVFK